MTSSAAPDASIKRKRSRSRAARLKARRAKAERKLRIFSLLAAGVPVADLAFQEGVSIRRMREVIEDILARREVDPPAGFVQLQIARLSDAMMVAHEAMMSGRLDGLDRVLRIVREFDRYYGFNGAPAAPTGVQAAQVRGPAPLPALTGPTREQTAENDLASC
jgi:hypothetical protein